MSHNPHEAVGDRPPTNADMTPQASIGVTPALPADLAPQTSIGRFKLPTAQLRAYTMLFALVLIWLYFYYSTSGIFLEARNFSNLMRQTSVTGVLAVGMLMVIVAGQIDLSVGSVVGLIGGIAAMSQGYGIFGALLIAIGIGILIGAFQGALTAYLNIPAFIVTLGGLLAWRGVILGLSKGETIPVTLAPFKSVGQDYLASSAGWGIAILIAVAVLWTNINRSRTRRKYGLAETGTAALILRTVLPIAVIAAFIYKMNAYKGVPNPVIILLAVALLGAFVMQNTTFGRYLYAIGGNPDAARLSGINLRAHILAVFCVMGALAGVASIIYTARVGSASPDAGTLLELDAIAACVIGGTSLMGGRGTVFGAILGALIMASLDNGMSLGNVAPYTQNIIKGAILVAAVGLDMMGRKKG
jgi:D-xylose transport system permease protein